MPPHPTLTSIEWEPIRRLDVTPFINVVFVLLVVALVTTPATTGGTHVLPTARHAEVVDPARVTITLLDGERFWLSDGADGDVLAEPDLAANLRNVFAREPAVDRILYLKADRGAAYRDVLPILHAAREAGVRRLGLLGMPESGQSRIWRGKEWRSPGRVELRTQRDR
jgi:biopolymer transport protein ExbD